MSSNSEIVHKFKKVYSELATLERKIFQRSGFLIFKSHIYTIEELLNSPHHQKIFSITEKIGSDMHSWYAAGKLLDSEEKEYFSHRNSVDTQLQRLNMKIQTRKPTWWEKTKGPLMEFVGLVLENLPAQFTRKMIGKVNKILLPFFKKIPKLLQFKKH